MSALEELLGRPSRLDVADLPAPPSARVAIVTCMDARIDLGLLLGLQPGEAHVIRNAGGIVTDDELRSLVISQRKLGTRSVLVLTHTQCGMASFDDGDFVAELEQETGEAPRWAPGAFADPAEAARVGAEAVRACVHLPHRDDVHAAVLDLAAGAVVRIDEGASL